jgi:hypothetical protein
MTLRFPEGLPNLASLDSIRITGTSVIVRAALGKPVYASSSAAHASSLTS